MAQRWRSLLHTRLLFEFEQSLIYKGRWSENERKIGVLFEVDKHVFLCWE